MSMTVSAWVMIEVFIHPPGVEIKSSWNFPCFHEVNAKFVMGRRGEVMEPYEFAKFIKVFFVDFLF